jgi:mitochondrial fission protein ELM1
MGKAPQFVRVLSDGRPGHENQSVGLAEAIARRSGTRVEIVRFAKGDLLWRRYCNAIAGEAKVDLLIATGHKTHLTLSLAARKLGAKSVVIMSPTWPLWFFDLCLAPQHDLTPGRRSHGRVIPTFGALNRVPEEIPAKQARGVVLIGGPSKAHGWSAKPSPIRAARRRDSWINCASNFSRRRLFPTPRPSRTGCLRSWAARKKPGSPRTASP